MSSEFEFQEDTAKIKAPRGKKAEQAAHLEVPKEGEETVNLLEGGSPEFDELELDQIFDSLMFEGSYTEEIKIGGKLNITLKTRSGKDARASMNLLDKAGYNLGLTMESIRALYNLAQSVVVINTKDMSGESLERRVELIEEMPTPVISAMMIALVKFDRKVEAAVRHGEENF